MKIYADALAFIKGKVKKINQTDKTIYLSSGEHYNIVKFNYIVGLARVAINQAEQLVADEKAKEFVGTRKRIVSLRYIVLSNYETSKYAWYFGRVNTSHATLELEYQKRFGHEWDSHAGGFYKLDWQRRILSLFGRSDTFGCNEEFIRKALPTLKEEHKQMKRIIFYPPKK